MLRYLFVLMAGLISFSAMAQRTIQGKVLDNTGEAMSEAVVQIKGDTARVKSDENGSFTLVAPDKDITLIVNYPGYKTKTVFVAKDNKKDVFAVIDPTEKTKAEIRKKVRAITKDQKALGYNASPVPQEELVASAQVYSWSNNNVAYDRRSAVKTTVVPAESLSSEEYKFISENTFHHVKDQPLSTFSIDVDRASYSNVRRYLNQGQLPPTDAVRVEEMINYFDYQYKAPTGKDPVAIYTDMAVCPWDNTHQLVRIALKGKEVANENMPPSNLVFLIDVSGSMWDANKLPLVKQAMKVLVQQLRPVDKVAIVVYAGAAGVVLPSTSGSEKAKILDALDQLNAGGSTAGGEGIKLAYNTASESFLKDGNNRVIMATDGDFNVGASSEDELNKLITKEKERGIFLSVLGFGMGNYKDNRLELLSDKGNGNYAYIDNFEEARRTFVTEFGSTLFTIAKDVKLQLEFNPKYISSYRLIGYENRLLANEDFNDDKKDAGEMGAGHTVTALYEIVPADGAKLNSTVDPLKYQENTANNKYPDEALTVKLRYKQPASNTSQLLSKVLPWGVKDMKDAPADFRMATAVAGLGLLLRNSEFKGKVTYEQVIQLATGAKGDDNEGYRAEFIRLTKSASLLQKGDKAISANLLEE